MWFTDPLAYLTAKNNGLDELAEEILAAAGLSPEDVASVLPSKKSAKLAPPPVVTPTFEHNWPAVGASESFFDKALTQAITNGDGPYADGYANGVDGAAQGLDEWAGDDTAVAQAGVPDEAAEEAWDLAPDEADVAAAEEEPEVVAAVEGGLENATPGVSEVDLWVRNSPLATDHVAAGSFETAMQVSEWCID